MSFRFLGHNCFEFKFKDNVLLTDPWFSEKGAFFGSWIQYPRNFEYLEDIIKDTNNFSNYYVYISHDHQDHFDLDTLRQFNKNTKLIIPKFKDAYFKSMIEQLDLTFIELEDEEECNINDVFRLKIFIADLGGHNDSALLIKTNEYSFLNQNDCKIFDRLRNIQEKITFYAVQYSGANWHPSCFDFEDKKKDVVTDIKVENKFINIISGIDILKPDFFIPSAGPAIFPFLDKSLSLGKNNIFVHQDTLNQRLIKSNIKNIIYLKPGDIFDKNKKKPIAAPTEQELKKIKSLLNNVWENIDIEFKKSKLISKIQKRLYQIKDIDLKGVPVIVFNWGDHMEKIIVINLNNKVITTTFDYKSPFIEIKAEEKYFALMHNSERWGDLVLSMRANVKRKPDMFNNIINIFINSDERNLKNNILAIKNISQERCLVTGSEGKVFEINRFCPHQGSDLKYAKVDEDNNLICPRHGWKFELLNKGFHQQSQQSIQSQKLK